jgi:hypothetical protein
VSSLSLQQQTAREGQIFKVDSMRFLLYCSLVLKLIYKCTYRYLCQTNLPINIIHYYAKLFICNYVGKKTADAQEDGPRRMVKDERSVIVLYE